VKQLSLRGRKGRNTTIDAPGKSRGRRKILGIAHKKKRRADVPRRVKNVVGGQRKIGGNTAGTRKSCCLGAKSSAGKCTFQKMQEAGKGRAFERKKCALNAGEGRQWPKGGWVAQRGGNNGWVGGVEPSRRGGRNNLKTPDHTK